MLNPNFLQQGLGHIFIAAGEHDLVTCREELLRRHTEKVHMGRMVDVYQDLHGLSRLGHRSLYITLVICSDTGPIRNTIMPGNTIMPDGISMALILAWFSRSCLAPTTMS